MDRNSPPKQSGTSVYSGVTSGRSYTDIAREIPPVDSSPNGDLYPELTDRWERCARRQRGTNLANISDVPPAS